MQILRSKTAPLLIIALSLFLCAAAAVYLMLPDVRVLENRYPVVSYQPSTEDTTIDFSKTPPPGWVPLKQVSKGAIGAVIASEDYSFFHHRGIDWSEIEIVLREEAWSGKSLRGASTITQQLAKNVFLTKNKTLLRKIREMILARRIERLLTKEEILERYLNVIEWGPGIYGIASASRHYFSKAPADLNAKEGAFLAALLPNPKKYCVSFDKKQLTPYVRKTVSRILGKMLSAGYLTKDEFEYIKNRPLSFENVELVSPLPELDQEDSPAADEVDDTMNSDTHEIHPGEPAPYEAPPQDEERAAPSQEQETTTPDKAEGALP